MQSTRLANLRLNSPRNGWVDGLMVDDAEIKSDFGEGWFSYSTNDKPQTTVRTSLESIYGHI